MNNESTSAIESGNRIETLLKEKGITKVRLAELLGTTKQNLHSIIRNPKQSTLRAIADALGVPVWQLFATAEEVREQCTDLAVSAGNIANCPHCGKPIAIDIKAAD